MTEFCEPCPLRGECKGPIEKFVVEDLYATDIFKRSNLIGRFVVAIDEAGHASEPIPYSPSYSKNAISKECEQRVGECEQPKTRLVPFLRPKDCGAFTDEIRPYETTPAIDVMPKAEFIAGILAKYVS